jgi:hypothetical protein
MLFFGVKKEVAEMDEDDFGDDDDSGDVGEDDDF